MGACPNGEPKDGDPRREQLKTEAEEGKEGRMKATGAGCAATCGRRGAGARTAGQKGHPSLGAKRWLRWGKNVV